MIGNKFTANLTKHSDFEASSVGYEVMLKTNFYFSNSTNVTQFSTNHTNDVEASELDVPYVVMEAIVATFAVLGNAFIIILFQRERKLRKRTNYYIISLAFADFLVGLLGIPFAILISIGLPHNHYVCLLMMTLLLSFCTISIFSLVLVSVDRFMSILFPMLNCDHKSYVKLEILSCWVLGALIGFLPFIWHKPGSIDRCLYHDIVTEGYQIFRFIFVILMPICVIFTIYAMIYKVVLHQLKHENLRSPCCCYYQNDECCSHVATRREIKVTFNVFVIALLFIICWFPLNIAKSIKILCKSCDVNQNFITFGIVLTHFNSAINPLLYAYNLKDFRVAFLKMIKLNRRDSSSFT